MRWGDKDRITERDIPRGLVCPECGNTHFWTTRTEFPTQGIIRRRKTCRRCGHRMITLEKSAADY